jgi:hypothetical protein
MTATPSRRFETPNRQGLVQAATVRHGSGRAAAGGYQPRFYDEAERMSVARAYHELFKGLGIAPLTGRKLYRFATRLGPAESSVDVSRRMAYVYFRYLDSDRAAAGQLPSDSRYSATFSQSSGKFNGHVVSDGEQDSSADLALQMVGGIWRDPDRSRCAAVRHGRTGDRRGPDPPAFRAVTLTVE